MIMLLKRNRNVILLIVMMLLMIVLAYWVSERLIEHLDDKIFR